jgi:hypothetical protein
VLHVGNGLRVITDDLDLLMSPAMKKLTIQIKASTSTVGRQPFKAPSIKHLSQGYLVIVFIKLMNNLGQRYPTHLPLAWNDSLNLASCCLQKCQNFNIKVQN